MKKSLVILASLFLCAQAPAQTGVTGLIKKVGTLIDSMSVRGLDRRYIDAPEKPWQIIVRGNVNQSILSMTAKGSIMGIDYDAKPYM